MSATTPVAASTGAFGLHLEGLRLLRRERSLWKLAAVPLVIALVCLGVTLALIFGYAGALHGLATSWMPELVAGAWYSWLWIGPLKLLFWGVGLTLFLALAGFLLVAAFLLATVIASPFNDALSRRVEQIVAGNVTDLDDPGFLGIVRSGGRAVSEELKRLFFFAAIQLAILTLGIVIPGGQLVAPLAMTGVTVLFLPLDYASYTLDRRHVPFREKRRWVVRHRSAMVGFGVGAFLTLLIPGLNFLAMPALVVSGTLLALRYPTSPSSS